MHYRSSAGTGKMLGHFARNFPMKRLLLALGLLVTSLSSSGADMSNGADNFYTSDKVTAENVTFNNQYGMQVAGTLFAPKNRVAGSKNPAIVVGHPMGAVRQQSANLYATKMAEHHVHCC
jgi:hypothetical protein